jgi:hypothetical protein
MGEAKCKLDIKAINQADRNRLSSEKSRGPLLKESSNAFASIISRNNAGKGGFLDRQSVVDRQVHTAMDCPECCRECEGWLGREEIGERQSLIEQIGAGHDTINQT